MPTSLIAAASIFIELNIDVEIVDENLKMLEFNHYIVGLNLLGAPYIKSAIDIEKKLFEKFNNNFKLLIGGQVVSGLDIIDMNNLFSKNTINGNSNEQLSKLLEIPENKIPKIENISFKKAYDKISDNNLKLYLQNEISFYLSQGCKYSCSFCAANRSFINSQTKIKNKNSEIYRDISIAIDDFEYLVNKAISFNIFNLKIYLSNLDLFQNPLKLVQFAEGIINFKKNIQMFI